MKTQSLEQIINALVAKMKFYVQKAEDCKLAIEALQGKLEWVEIEEETKPTPKKPKASKPHRGRPFKGEIEIPWREIIPSIVSTLEYERNYTNAELFALIENLPSVQACITAKGPTITKNNFGTALAAAHVKGTIVHVGERAYRRPGNQYNPLEPMQPMEPIVLTDVVDPQTQPN